MSSRVILLVEDNHDDEALMLFALQQNQIANPVVIARTGVQALDYLFGKGTYSGRDSRLTPQLILLDLQLPQLNGLEVLQQIRSHQHTQFTPVVILTTSIAEQDLQASYCLHANSYIQKPVDFAKFTDIVGNLALYWLEFNELPPLAGD